MWLKDLLVKIFRGGGRGKTYIKAIAVGRFQDEAEGKVIQSGWIKPPPAGQPAVYDNARGAFLFLLDQEKLKPIIPASLPDEDAARIEYAPGKGHPLWAVAKSILFLEDGRTYVWPDTFSFYKKALRRFLRERDAAFSQVG